MSRGPLLIVGYLALIMVVIILISATLLTVFRLIGVNGDTHRVGYAEAFWQEMLRVLDTGTFANDQHWAPRIIALFVTLSGILIAGSLIGLIANAIDQKLDELRRGRSSVIEEHHTLVLGWSERLPVILSELVIANENQRREAFVVLADRPKDEMEDELARHVSDTKTTRVVCRTGDIGSIDDLHLVNVEGARSVIVLAGEDGDAGVVKAVLALRSIDPTFERLRVVVELQGAENADTLSSLTDRRIATVHADEVISQLTAQACHQSGLAGVFRDLIDFDGDEIYFRQIPELAGHTYREALQSLPDSSMIGVLHDRQVLLNPDADYVFAAEDEVIAIAADDDRVVFGGFASDITQPRTDPVPYYEPARRVLIIGWSSLGATVLIELDQFLSTGSAVDLIVDAGVFGPDEVRLPECGNCQVNVHRVSADPRKLLEIVRAGSYDEVIVLGYRRKMSAADADARSMLTLLALQKAFAGVEQRPRIVAEMLERGNVAVAQTTGADDFIVSDELASLMIAQLSERLELQDVFAKLFDQTGAMISLQPASIYTDAEPTTYAAIVAAAVARGETAIGYGLDGTVRLNPPKATPLEFGPSDQVLVLGPRRPRTADSPPQAVDAAPAPRPRPVRS